MSVNAIARDGTDLKWVLTKSECPDCGRQMHVRFIIHQGMDGDLEQETAVLSCKLHGEMEFVDIRNLEPIYGKDWSLVREKP
jgi:hypothetical protein